LRKHRKKIGNTYVDENGKANPIIDGIVDIEKFQAKILNPEN
jgi:hypothetical protein